MSSSKAPEPEPAVEVPDEPGTGSPRGEFIAFLRENKRWWLIPVVASLLLFVALVVLSRNTAAPFVYTLF